VTTTREPDAYRHKASGSLHFLQGSPASDRYEPIWFTTTPPEPAPPAEPTGKYAMVKVGGLTFVRQGPFLNPWRRVGGIDSNSWDYLLGYGVPPEVLFEGVAE
jgi:hypothetical protein